MGFPGCVQGEQGLNAIATDENDGSVGAKEPLTAIAPHLHHSKRPRYRGFTNPCNLQRNHGQTTTLYLIRSGEWLKIGITQDLEKRVRQFEAGNPRGITVEATRRLPRSLARQVERRLHEHFAGRAIGREWFADLTSAEVLKVAAPLINAANYAALKLAQDLL